MYLVYRGAPVTTPRAYVLNHTVHRAGQPPVPVAVVMLGVSRITPARLTAIGRRALDTLSALGVNTGSTDPLAFATRFAGPVEHLELSAEFTRPQDNPEGTLSYGYTHTRGGGQYPGTLDVLDHNGNAYAMPPIDYSAPIN